MKMKLFLTILVLFIVFQPVLDVLTTINLNFTDSTITIGIIVRMTYLFIIIGCITYFASTSLLYKRYFYYLFGLAIILLINFVLNYNLKSPYLLVQEITFYSKVVYFNIVFLGFLIILEELRKRGIDLKQQLIKFFVISGIIIGIVFILSELTGTSLKNYSWNKVGVKGWFFAGNDIGGIMAIILPITALGAVYFTKKWKDIVYWIPFVLLSYSMLALGTKVGYVGILIVLIAVIITSVIVWFTKEKIASKITMITSSTLLILLALLTPLTPLYQNMFTHLELLGISTDKEEEVPNIEELEEDQVKDDEPAITGAQMENLIFSSREQYVKVYQQQFSEAPVTQKLFGMGYAGNYSNNSTHLKMIEMDFHDLFYSFGYIGFIYLLIPILYFSFKHIMRVIRALKENFNYYIVLTGVAFIIGIGIAYTAGHVLTSPTVSIYIAFLLATLIIHFKSEQNDN